MSKPSSAGIEKVSSGKLGLGSFSTEKGLVPILRLKEHARDLQADLRRLRKRKHRMQSEEYVKQETEILSELRAVQREAIEYHRRECQRRSTERSKE